MQTQTSTKISRKMKTEEELEKEEEGCIGFVLALFRFKIVEKILPSKVPV